MELPWNSHYNHITSRLDYRVWFAEHSRRSTPFLRSVYLSFICSQFLYCSRGGDRTWQGMSSPCWRESTEEPQRVFRLQNPLYLRRLLHDYCQSTISYRPFPSSFDSRNPCSFDFTCPCCRCSHKPFNLMSWLPDYSGCPTVFSHLLFLLLFILQLWIIIIMSILVFERLLK